jgi:peptidoglycan/xylan/chitin deacetylase (PgdA/CDA1 family)
MNNRNNLTVDLLTHADACIDWISVHKMDFLTQLSRYIMPRGFWGDGHAVNAAYHPEPSKSRVYLTFDDGPSPHTTPWLLEMLEKESIQASFFLIGQEAERYPELVEAIHRGGHSIGNHSYTHQLMPGLKVKDLETEVERTNQIVEEITGVRPTIFRPPYGLMCYRTAQVLTEREMHPVYWSQAPEDWAAPGAHRVMRRLLMRLKPGSLIVLHEGKDLREQTLAAANELIYRCKSSEFDLEKVQLRA